MKTKLLSAFITKQQKTKVTNWSRTKYPEFDVCTKYVLDVVDCKGCGFRYSFPDLHSLLVYLESDFEFLGQ